METYYLHLRKGELEAVSVSKKCDRAVFKMKGRPTLFVPLKEVDVATASGNLHDGLGQSRHGYFWLKLDKKRHSHSKY